LAQAGREPGRALGKIAHDINKLHKMLVKMGPAVQLHIVYEAGPTGYGLQRALQAKGYECEVIAPRRCRAVPGIA
jgi:transposase